MLLRTGKGEDKLGSHPFCTDNINMLVVSLDDLLDDRKSETCALLVFSAGKIGFIEALPYLIQRFLWNSDSVILYGDEHFAVFLHHFDSYGRIILTEFDCIVYEIV